MPAMHDFATWEPLLRILRADGVRTPAAPDGHLAGRIGRRGWVRAPRRPRRGRASRAELDAVERVLRALADAEARDVCFKAEVSPTGATALHLIDPGPAVEPGFATVHPGALLLVEGALAEPWRRLPDPTPGAAPSPSADPALLERTLRAQVPGARGATEAEIAAAEERLGVTLPDELKVLHRVTAAGRRGRGDVDGAAEHLDGAVDCELLPLERLYVARAPTRPCDWRSAAMQVVDTPPGAAVQGLVGSPGWIVFAVGGGGDPIAVDLTPGPRGALGQIVLIDHEQVIGGELLADSLTDLVVNGRGEGRRDRPGDRPRPGARTDLAGLTDPRAVVDPRLEVLSTGGWQGAPLSLVPVMGLPRLRTLTASPGTLADPLEIARLTALEFLELGPQDWRVLLDAGAVPRSLEAASIEVHRDQDPLPVVDLANEILALRDRPPITRTVLHGDLGPL
ncbi:SMI1/KNR4 family protein [Streptomyces sp. NBC_01439]|uniref:SMI1/KNR4 family protein n=1 Tax=Streptomyces sp. NBC_01439 TaxID=2903867 RepID=UPI002E2CE3E4|nr:SMI1/KNR4 family protein [Streptomyces sp. NBC_01439]